MITTIAGDPTARSAGHIADFRLAARLVFQRLIAQDVLATSECRAFERDN